MSNYENLRKDPKFIASAILVGLIVIAGIVLATLYAFGGTDDRTSEPTDPAASNPKGAATSSACGLPNGNQDIPITAPTTEWYFLGKIAAPKSPSLGPAQKEGGVETCFAHSPSGAVFAAGSMAAQLYSGNNPTEQQARALIMPGPLLEATLAEPSSTSDGLAQVAGFRVESYTPARATVSLAVQLTTGPNVGGLGASPVTLVWSDGDWKWELTNSSGPVSLSNLSGYTEWSAIR